MGFGIIGRALDVVVTAAVVVGELLLTMVGVVMIDDGIEWPGAAETAANGFVAPELAMIRLPVGMETVGGGFCWMLVLTSRTFMGCPSFWADV